MSFADSTSITRISLDEHDNDRNTDSVPATKKEKSDSSSIVEVDSSSDSSSETRINCCADWDKPIGEIYDKHSRKERLLFGGFCAAIGLATIGITAFISSKDENFTPLFSNILGVAEGAFLMASLSHALQNCRDKEACG